MEEEIRQLADIICEGQGSNLVVIAARPLMGKTQLSLHLTHHLFKEGKKTAYFSLKWPSQNIKRYIFSISADVEKGPVSQDGLPAKDLDKNSDVEKYLSCMPLTIHEYSSCSTEEVKLKAIKQKNTTGLDVIIIDYLQLLRSTAKYDTSREKTTKILYDLKAIAEELSVSVIVLSQLSRSVENRDDRRPEINDLQNFGQVETVADIIIFLYSDSYYRDKPTNGSSTEIIIAKNSHGKPVKS
ncbi:MAG: DnaB-like helicase C-terminal domain-containing protein [Bacillota bacterium]